MRASRRAIVVLSAPGSLPGLGRRLGAEGLRAVRIPTVTRVAVEPRRWLPRAPVDGRAVVVVVTSAFAVASGVVPWREHARSTSRAVYWAVGPRTEARLRSAGVGAISRPPRPTTESLAAAIGPGPVVVLRFRSDLAGAQLATRLRSNGRTVRDLVVYRTVPRTSLRPAELRAVRRAVALLATSPSALRALRPSLRDVRHGAWLRDRPVVVLGGRTARAARGAGFRHVRVPPTFDREGLTRTLLEVAHEGERGSR